MLAFVSTPITMPRFRPGRAAGEQDFAGVTDVIWNLHSILTNPASTPAEAGRAKHQMLRVLDETKHRSLPEMIVPAMSFSPEPAEDTTTLLDDSHMRGSSKRPITRGLRNRGTVTKRERASSSRLVRTKALNSRRETASLSAARANLTVLH